LDLKIFRSILAFNIRGHGENTPYSSSEDNESGIVNKQSGSEKSQCSTLVRNTVVRATFKVNGKSPIWGSRSPLTP